MTCDISDGSHWGVLRRNLLVMFEFWKRKVLESAQERFEEVATEDTKDKQETVEEAGNRGLGLSQDTVFPEVKIRDR